MENELTELLQIRHNKLKNLSEQGINPYEITKCEMNIHANTIRENFEEYENKDVILTGRIMSWRDMGKAGFMDIQDQSGKLQVYFKINDLGENFYENLSNWDIGDIITVSGFVFKTRRGEISVHAKEMKLLSKSLLPLPEKFHGLRDTDLRYRQRYVDLIMNPDVKDTFIR